MTLMRFDAIRAGYDSASVLCGISIAIAKGEKVAVLGRNGVGKTTIVNTILGITQVHEGQIWFGEKSIERPRHFVAARAGISIVPQGRHIVAALTVRENLLLGGAAGRKGQWTLESIYKLFPVLKERCDAPGTALSGGQQQMLAIARALMANPDLLVLDEPSEGLAPVIVDEVAATLNGLAARGTGVLLIEQNIGLVRRVAERYYILSKGAVVDSGALEGLSLEALKRHVAV
jgi:branched-chain amino acid transport system ATP-binding protein